MLIDKNTKIGKILKAHPEALGHIISMNPIFEKLRNPVLRKLMANRTSIAMAAKVGNLVPADFFKALEPLGFEFQISESNQAPPQPNHAEPFDIKSQHIISMDVRPILANGEDPLQYILAKVKVLNSGEILKIINTFEPTPLIRMLEKQGFQTYVKRLTDSHVETYFRKNTSENIKEDPIPGTAGEEWDEVVRKFEGKTEKVDVRDL